jgi:RNA polymerase sigma-70 factor (ECF subfamily)
MQTMFEIQSLDREKAAAQALEARDSAREQKLDVTAIFKAHHAFVWRILRHLGVPAADQEDVLQEVFVVVHRRLADYLEQDKMRSWLYAISTRVVRDHRRRISRRHEDPREAPDLSEQASQAHAAADQQALTLAQRMLATLPEKQRAVFVLYEIEQLSMPEIAAAVECPLPTAYARLRKARERVLAEVARARLKGDVP